MTLIVANRLQMRLLTVYADNRQDEGCQSSSQSANLIAWINVRILIESTRQSVPATADVLLRSIDQVFGLSLEIKAGGC
jgi:hypothetical protein